MSGDIPHLDLRADGRLTQAEHDLRMAAARARAEWELGDGIWASIIIAAYMNPEADRDALLRERDR